MSNKEYDLDAWKDFILNLLIERGGASLKDFVWDCLIEKYPTNNKQKGYYLFRCVLKCLEEEFQLIKTSDSRGIQITEEGKYVAHKGFRSYINSKRRHEKLKRINDYISTLSSIISIISAIITFANIYYEKSNILYSLIITIIFIVITIVSRLACKTKNNR